MGRDISRRPHALYRFHGEDESLLYVGITLDPGARWASHSHDKPWWREVGTITVECYPDRSSVLAAERDAIRCERPRYNVIHNSGPVAPAPVPELVEPNPSGWTFRSLRSGYQRTCFLAYYYEVADSAMSDDYHPADYTADDLLWAWADRMDAKGVTEVPIYWYVVCQLEGVFEAAPFCPSNASLYPGTTFLDFYTWPIDHDYRHLNWLSLPVVDGHWTQENATKGGFIQEATGWKPSPLVQAVGLDLLLGRRPRGV